MERRAFLKGAAALGSFGGVAAADIVVANARTENPELLRQCDGFDASIVEYRAAIIRRDQAVTQLRAIAPAIPDEIKATFDERWVSDEARLCDCVEIRDERGYRLRILNQHQFDLRADEWQRRSRKMRQRLAALNQYETELEGARMALGIEQLQYAASGAWATARRFGEAAGTARAETSLGLMRKATVAHGMSTMEDNMCRTNFLFGQDFWAEMVAVLGKEVA